MALPREERQQIIESAKKAIRDGWAIADVVGILMERGATRAQAGKIVRDAVINLE